MCEHCVVLSDALVIGVLTRLFITEENIAARSQCMYVYENSAREV
jgi:hypothetical protein